MNKLPARQLILIYINSSFLNKMLMLENNKKTLLNQAVDDPQKNVMELVLRPGADPFVMMAWRCKFLEEIVIHGYVMDPYNLVGVSRLMGRNLKRLEVSMIDSEAISGIMDSFIEVRL